MSTNTPAISRDEATRGFLFALSAYLMWGVLPFYMKAVAHIPAPEVIAHRIIPRVIGFDRHAPTRAFQLR